MGGRTIVRFWGKDVGYQNVTLLVPNIGTITFIREGFGGKSPLFQLCSLITTRVVQRVCEFRDELLIFLNQHNESMAHSLQTRHGLPD